MLKTINIDGQDIQFRSDGALPRFYRQELGRDMFRDLNGMGSDDVGASMEAVENLAYAMARYADKDSVPDSVDEWLEEFDTFSIYMASAEIVKILNVEQMTQSHAKKKSVK